MNAKIISVAVAICILIIIIGAGVYSVLTTSVNMSGGGTINGIGISANPASLNFGSFDAGTPVLVTTVLTDTGNVNETLTMSVQGLPSYLTLTWNGTTITPTTPVTVGFLLTSLPTSIGGAFSCNVTITGTAP